MLKDNSFYASVEVIKLKNDLLYFYSESFLDGDVKTAQKILEPDSYGPRTIDVGVIWFFIGMVIPTVYMMLGIVVLENMIPQIAFQL